MFKVFLIRHGESIWNHGSKFTGWTNIPLTKYGKLEGKIIGTKLGEMNIKPDVFYSSVLDRALDTATIIKDTLNIKAPIHTSWRLNEKHYGTLEGVPRDYLRNEYGDKFTNILRHNFYMRPPVIPSNYRTNTEYPIYKNCYFDKIKNGESKENVLQRSLPYFENDILYSFNENKVPFVVTHKHCLRVLMKHYLNLSDEEFESYSIPDKKILEMNFDKNMKFVTHSFINY